MELTFINDLNESRQYRSKSAFRKTTARQAADMLFMDMIAIWILYNEFEFAPEAIEYAGRTVSMNRFNTYRQTGTDLYMNLHVVTEKRTDLLDSTQDVTLLDRVNVDVASIIRYLRAAASNKLSQHMVMRTLQKLERGLAIDNSNYRSVRRLAQSWPTLTTSQKRLVLTRMLFFYKSNARRAELFGYLNLLARSKNLVAKNAKNPESNLKKFAAAAVVTGAAAAIGYSAGRRLAKGLI